MQLKEVFEMQNCKELRAELASVFRGLRTGKIQSKDAAALANLAGKMISSAKVQVEYAALRKEPPNINFLRE